MGGRFAPIAATSSFSVNVEVMKPNLALGLNVLADILQNPIFPEEVALEKAAQIAAIKAEDEQITTVARNIMREKLFGKHPYALRNSGRADSVEDHSRRFDGLSEGLCRRQQWCPRRLRRREN